MSNAIGAGTPPAVAACRNPQQPGRSRTHWGWCQHLERLGILDSEHQQCVRSSSGGCVVSAQRPRLTEAVRP